MSAQAASTTSFNDKTWVKWVGLALRLILGGLFIYAGAPKILGNDAFRRSLMAYQLFPTSIVGTIAIVVPILEVAFGLLLVFGLFTRIAALGVTFLLVVYIAAIISVWARHISIDCGCFSSGGLVTKWSDAVKGYKRDILRDAVMAAGAVWLVFFPRTVLAVDGWLRGPAVTYDEADFDEGVGDEDSGGDSDGDSAASTD